MNAADGVYRVSEATYSGNNMDGEFIVQMTCESIQSGKVNEGVNDMVLPPPRPAGI